MIVQYYMDMLLIKNKTVLYLLVVIGVIMLLIIGYVGVIRFSMTRKLVQDDFSCITSAQALPVKGESMQGMISGGSSVQIRWGFYDCNAPKVGDIVAEQGASRGNINLKIVRAVPGDDVEFVQQNASWNILVNKQVVKTSSGEPYQLSDTDHALLMLYFKYGGTVNANNYLLLNNVADTSRDSTFKGLVDQSSLLGKAVVQ